jgi:hypothetical protein
MGYNPAGWHAVFPRFALAFFALAKNALQK